MSPNSPAPRNPSRPRRRRFENPGEPRFLTFSCYQRLPLFLNDRIKLAFIDQLERIRDDLRFDLVAWVIMPEHVHLLIIPRHEVANVTTILQSLKQPFARKVIARWRELAAPILEAVTDASGRAHFWQRGGGYDRNITSEHEWFEKLSYINNNPVRRGLVTSAEDYPWSSARAHAHDDRALPLKPDLDRRYR